mmetsp:Transcript_400/g.733  ORF Transcript_400/g.733 Transcript_400/m.733 type:complete len:90 (+) Transcript_400:2181-2450(+)
MLSIQFSTNRDDFMCVSIWASRPKRLVSMTWCATAHEGMRLGSISRPHVAASQNLVYEWTNQFLWCIACDRGDVDNTCGCLDWCSSDGP